MESMLAQGMLQQEFALSLGVIAAKLMPLCIMEHSLRAAFIMISDT